MVRDFGPEFMWSGPWSEDKWSVVRNLGPELNGPVRGITRRLREEDFADEEPPELYQMLGMVKGCLSLVRILSRFSRYRFCKLNTT